ncbi:hypothetical protein E4T43_06824 [Aureobasidium subglaciale]|nr:hypothetical protein E4T43_06824 [Aureobasidium subglaciale]
MSDPRIYTVGWICALSNEYVAARQFLDEEHRRPTQLNVNNHTAYTLGEIEGHNVVIATLPLDVYGTISAATVTTDMLNSFPNIKFGLMVGIGGGAPTAKHDIRLGDVVVSSPAGHTSNRVFEQTGLLNQPPGIVLSAISTLQGIFKSEGHNIDGQIKDILEKKPQLMAEFGRPTMDTDLLYRSDFVHPGSSEDDCQKICGRRPSDLVQREPRGSFESLTIHYGVIASADILMKDAIIRDKLASEKSILCFEMEAAGLMNNFPCLVVRGICDYSDSHKNKRWQGYAAMTAAAYAKEVLAILVPNQVEAQVNLGTLLESSK